MKRQKRYMVLDDSCPQFRLEELPSSSFSNENTLEAQVQSGDTLQALALRFHCTITDIKRLNKIDKDNEIFARKTVKIPVTPHSILLETLPTVHKSGQNSPKRYEEESSKENNASRANVLSRDQLNEKLLVASVNSSEIKQISTINDIILNSKFRKNNYTNNDQECNNEDASVNDPLFDKENDLMPQPTFTQIRPNNVFDCSGSDCDISWICLFICILAICFAIPLIYILYIAEHPEKYIHNTSKINQHLPTKH